MAKKQNTTQTDEITQNPRDRRRIIVGLSIASVTVYIAFAFISYLFTWQIDQSTLDIPVNKLFFNSNIGNPTCSVNSKFIRIQNL